MDWLTRIHGAPAAPAAFHPGDEVRVWYRIREQEKERLGQFEGTVIRLRGAGAGKTFTVRRVTYGVGVERVFPVDAKIISRIEVVRRGHVRRSRLYYLRSIIGKARIESADVRAALKETLASSSAGGTTPPAPPEGGADLAAAHPADTSKPAA